MEKRKASSLKGTTRVLQRALEYGQHTCLKNKMIATPLATTLNFVDLGVI